LVLAGLVADGETIVHRADQILRGYEAFAQRLNDLGADIRED
jgi:UDP-N-acetylglucosamine 1-carboxyvinyltransferase